MLVLQLVPPAWKMALNASTIPAARFLPYGGGAQRGRVFRKCVVLFFPPFLSSLCSRYIRGGWTSKDLKKFNQEKSTRRETTVAWSQFGNATLTGAGQGRGKSCGGGAAVAVQLPAAAATAKQQAVASGWVRSRRVGGCLGFGCRDRAGRRRRRLSPGLGSAGLLFTPFSPDRKRASGFPARRLVELPASGPRTFRQPGRRDGA